MFVIAQHKIHDPIGFWHIAKESTLHLPGPLRVISVFPSKDAKFGTCLWEANSVSEVQEYLDSTAGKFADNFCYELDMAGAMGLPSIKNLTVAVN